LWSATAVRASAGTRSPYIIRPEGVLEQAKSNLWITYAEVRRLLLRCFGGFGGGLLLFLELAYLLQGEVIDDIGDGATAVLVTVVPGGFPPSLGLESELLAQQREEDLRLLIAESRKLLQPLEHFGATGVAPGPDGFGLTVVVVDDGRGQLLHPRCHRLRETVDGRAGGEGVE